MFAWLRSSLLPSLVVCGVALSSMTAAAKDMPASVHADAYPIFPPPREKKLGKAAIPLSTRDTVIVTGVRLTDPEQRALEILQSAIGQCKVVRSPGQPLSGGTRIVLGQPASNPLLRDWLAARKVKLTPQDLGEQGHVIECAKDCGGWTVALGGSDDAGVLYGAQSFAQLVVKDARGIRARECHIRDWPGPPIRMVGYSKELSALYPALRTNVIYDATPAPPPNAGELRRNGALFTSYEYWTMQGLKTSKPRSESTSYWSDSEVNRLWTESYVRFDQPNTIAVCTSGDGTNAFATGISLVRE